MLGETIRAKTKNDGSFGESNQEILVAYFLVINAPEAILSLGTLIFEMTNGELSPTGGKGYHDDEGEDASHGHLP